MTPGYREKHHTIWLLALWLVAISLPGCGAQPQTLDAEHPIQRPTATIASQAANIQTVTPDPAPLPSPTPEPDSTFDALRLYNASLHFIADTEEDAVEIAKTLGYLDNDGHPSNMCGPLALAIMRDAGLVDPQISLHDFWLINPRYNLRLLEQTFPREAYLWYRSRIPINQFDFHTFPLQAGDLLYLYAEPGGSFEHLLVVTRVDEDGKAYTVTNHNTEAGYQIHELMLYDPANPSQGLFYEWTNWKNVYLGLTGFGGFDLWRKRETSAGTPPEQLVQFIDETITTYGGDWQILIREKQGAILYSREADRRVHIASVIKIPIVLLFLKSLESQNLPDLVAYLDTYGVDERSYQQLLRASLVFSEEQATESLVGVIKRNELNVTTTLQNWGADRTDVKTRTSTANEIAILLEGLYDGKLLQPEAQTLMLDLMSAYTPNDDSRLGLIQKQLPDIRVYNKRGTITDEFLIVADVALIVHQDKQYTFILFSRQDSQNHTTYELLEQAAAEIAEAFARYLEECSSPHAACP